MSVSMCAQMCACFRSVYVCMCVAVCVSIPPSFFLSVSLILFVPFSLTIYHFLSFCRSLSHSLYLSFSLSLFNFLSLAIFPFYRQIHQLMALRGILPSFIGLGLSHVLPEYSHCIHNADKFFVNGLNKGKI